MTAAAGLEPKDEAMETPDLSGIRERTEQPQEASGVSIKDIVKQFGDFTAVDGVTMDIAQNEFFSILGPSGCGKTTLMRMIAGFERPTSGEILLLGRNVEKLPPNQRDLNMVFQNYALFPHLSVFNNVAFELRVRRTDRGDIKQRVSEMLELVQLAGLENRKPAQLSGGQRQRVALARALVGNPTVLLLDEPLGALDQKLRKGMQVELKRIQREVGITFIYVTHDQEEALTMSDRVAVMHAGKPLQIDSPRALYDSPETEFVASFIGRSNFLRGTVADIANGGRVSVDVPAVGVIHAHSEARAPATGDAVTVAVRPERVSFADASSTAASGNRVDGVIRDVMFAGDDTEYIVAVGDDVEFSVRQQNRGEPAPAQNRGDQVSLTWSEDSSRVLVH